MPSKRKTLFRLALAFTFAGGAQVALAAELMTLFTTPEERQVINSNRYKTDEVERPVVVEEVDDTPLPQLLMEEVTRQYEISGITVSREGPHTVWINRMAYLDGDQLGEDIQVRVLVGNEVRVRITAPDGKHFYGTSGETVDVTFLAPVGTHQ